MAKINAFRFIGWLLAVCVVLAAAGAYALLASYIYLAPSLPTVDAMRSGSVPIPLRIFTRSGELIAQIGEKRRVPVAYDDVPVLVRTQDDTKLEELQSAGATEVVPETFEASLMLLSHLLLLLKVPVSGVIRTVNDIRGHRYGMLRQIFRAEGAEYLDDSHAYREELHSVVLPPHAWAVGRSVAELQGRGSKASVSALRRDGIVGREPAPETVFKVGDVVVVCGTPEAVEHAETLLLMG